jgi:hypothetical protein
VILGGRFVDSCLGGWFVGGWVIRSGFLCFLRFFSPFS